MIRDARVATAMVNRDHIATYAVQTAGTHGACASSSWEAEPATRKYAAIGEGALAAELTHSVRRAVTGMMTARRTTTARVMTVTRKAPARPESAETARS